MKKLIINIAGYLIGLGGWILYPKYLPVIVR